MKKLLAVLVVAGLVGQAPVTVGQIFKCGKDTYQCQWSPWWNNGHEKLLCKAPHNCGGRVTNGCTCSTKVFGS
ncbi:MAG: hypothetical protein CL816_04435 [Coxiellaceae bacterium]|nr:hypothetical protein [Coxiellaceae bacterium]